MQIKSPFLELERKPRPGHRSEKSWDANANSGVSQDVKRISPLGGVGGRRRRAPPDQSLVTIIQYAHIWAALIFDDIIILPEIRWFPMSGIAAEECEEDFTMAETTKLSVGKALEKLQGTESPKSKMTRLDEKIDALEKETQRMRAERRRLERDQKAGLNKSD